MIELDNFNLSDEQKKGINEAIETMLKNEYIPMHRFKASLEENKNLKQKLSDSQLSAQEMDTLQASYKKLQEDYQALESKHESEISKMKLDYAVDDVLKQEKARNYKHVRPLLDYSKIQLDKDGKLVGLQEQIENLKKSSETGYLFVTENDLTPRGVTPSVSESAPKEEKQPFSGTIHDLVRMYYEKK